MAREIKVGDFWCPIENVKPDENVAIIWAEKYDVNGCFVGYELRDERVPRPSDREYRDVLYILVHSYDHGSGHPEVDHEGPFFSFKELMDYITERGLFPSEWSHEFVHEADETLVDEYYKVVAVPTKEGI